MALALALLGGLVPRAEAVSATGGTVTTYTSGGTNWTARGQNGSWSDVAASADGSVMAAAVFNGPIWVSSDYGTNWTATASGNAAWVGLALSADGTRLAAAVQNGALYTSTNRGATYLARTGAGTRNWSGVASSADGNRLVAAANPGQIFTSTDAGATWRTNAFSAAWTAVAASADGANLAAAVNGGNIHTSSDGGGTWTRGVHYIKQALSEVGLEVKLESTDWPTFSRRSGNWEFDVDCNSYGQYGDPAIGTSRFFLTSNIRKGVPQTNLQGYSNPEVDALFAKAAVAVEPAEAQRHYSRLQQVLTHDVAMVWLYERKPMFFYNKRLKNVIMGPNGPADGFGAVTLA